MAGTHAPGILSHTSGVSFPRTNTYLTWLIHCRPQLTPEAIKHLCSTLGTNTILADERCRKAINLPPDMNIVEIPEYPNVSAPSPAIYTTYFPPPDIPFYFHTSGTSAGLPKPIPQTDAAVSALPSFTGCQSASFSTTPLYHGGIADCLRAWTSGAMIWFFPEGVAPITASNLVTLAALIRQPTYPPVIYFSAVPYILQMLAEDKEGLELLRSMDLVGFGGAALPETVGDRLVNAGVNLLSRFGSAECGFLMSSHRDYASDKNWRHLRTTADPTLLNFERRENGLSELVVGPAWPLRSKTNRDDGSFATADLFEPHSSILGAWRHHSRADGLIALANGKKFDPAPLEGAIVAAAGNLQDVLVFGAGRDYPGILLFPRSDHQAGDVIEKVWPVLETINRESQNHARISKAMMVVVPWEGETPLEKSSKGTILRQQAEKRYIEAIESAYSNGPSSLAAEGDLGAKVEACFAQVLGRKIDPTKDIYQQGVDSMSCVKIRKLIESECLPGEQLPLNVIYDQGTMDSLVQYLRRRDAGTDEDDTSSEQHQMMKEMVERFGDFDEISWEIARKPGIVVVLTGATGFLGAHVLDILRQDTKVDRIICLVRAETPATAHVRVDSGLRDRRLQGLEAFTSETSRTAAKVSCLPCSISAHHLGLSDEDHAWLCQSTSIIIHVAWTVNFTLRLPSFEDQIVGTRNLISTAAASSARFALVSSTAAVSSSSAHPVPEALSTNPQNASPLGYSQSKWVAEGVLAAAVRKASPSETTPPALILRVGQLCGNQNGVWNATEAYPLLLSTAAMTGCLPDLPGTALDWLPVEIAAQAVIEAALGEQLGAMPVYHVVNSREAPMWKEMLEWIRASGYGPKFEVVPTAQWVARLETALGEHRGHPSQALLGLWKGMSAEAAQALAFEVAKTEEAVDVMRSVVSLDRERVVKMWRWAQGLDE
ncbi:male sterility protein-domain-containing protein [Plectosphaerella plurivora]|uniref:Male sterility protein-domain-containing protein n=1 Tax=Plectosphaerella plurivora TaxID=936078 RepID=A0A9P8V9B4_9PEZI|nr:male sterility protein-domain-containing protein [Plectosphaerella plurivora]